jgi:membrane associated rhomboid family serine protease
MNDRKEISIFKRSIFYTFSFIFLLWFIKALEWGTHLDFGFLGVYPRTFYGTIGIFFGPLIHGNIFHLLSNTFPLILLGVGVFYFYNKIAKEVFLWIYFLSGFFVWVIARDAYHIGASGVVYGLVSFLFISGLVRKDVRSIAISLIILILYRGMLYGLIPGNDSISWESHIMGASVGLVAAIYFRKVPVDPVMNIVLPDEKIEDVEKPSNENFQYYYKEKSQNSKKHISYSSDIDNFPEFKHKNLS